MTALSVPRSRARTTTFERVLLQASAAADRYVAARMARRTSATARAVLVAQEAAADVRHNARALGAIGLPPR
jgi:hypothetical protein